MSCPVVLTPSQCSADGSASGGNEPSVGEYGAISGAKIAISAKKPTVIRPTRAFLLDQTTLHHGSGRSASKTCSTGAASGPWAIASTVSAVILLPSWPA